MRKIIQTNFSDNIFYLLCIHKGPISFDIALASMAAFAAHPLVESSAVFSSSIVFIGPKTYVIFNKVQKRSLYIPIAFSMHQLKFI